MLLALARRLIDIHSSGCPPERPSGRQRLAAWELLAAWLAGGAVVLAATVLGVRRWAADRAADAEQRMRDLRAVHAVESDIAEVGHAACGLCVCPSASGREA